jgi:hypothetical protein
MKRDTVRQIVVVVATVAVIVVNALANALPFNGLTTGEISDSFDVFFVPAGYVFSIWGLIYVGLVAYTVYQALPAQRENPLLRSTGWPYVVSCVANITWIFLWHYLVFVPTLLAMLTLLVALLIIYLRLRIGRRRFSTVERWLVQLPFSIYLGWITVATIANVTAVLEHVGWDGAGIAPAAWAVIMIIVAGLVTVVMNLTRRDVAYALVLVWALIGIAVAQWQAKMVAGAAVVMVAVILATLWGALREVEPQLQTYAEPSP